MPKLKNISLGTWMAQFLKYSTFHFDSGHNLIIHEIEPHVGL